MSSVCRESHKFQPFSSKTSGATTTVLQSLTFIGEAVVEIGDTTELSFQSSLGYRHQDAVRLNPERAAMSILAKFTNIAEESQRPELFIALVHSLRQMPYADMVKLFYNTAPGGPERKFFLDAIPLIKTDAGVTLMANAIRNREVAREVDLDSWYSTLSFYKNPSRGMLATVSVILSPNSLFETCRFSSCYRLGLH